MFFLFISSVTIISPITFVVFSRRNWLIVHKKIGRINPTQAYLHSYNPTQAQGLHDDNKYISNMRVTCKIRNEGRHQNSHAAVPIYNS